MHPTRPPGSCRALLRLAALSTALAALPACAGGSLQLGFFTPDLHVEFLSVSSKTVPGALEDDGDVKDVKLSDRATFKPSKGTTSGIAKRLRMKSKRDEGAACFLSERQTTGNVSARVRVAFDSSKGLVDGISTAFLERRPVPQGEEPVLRVEATYDAALDGFTVRYFENGAPMGQVFDMPDGTHDLHLYMTDAGTTISAEAAQATGESLGDIGASTSWNLHDQTGGDETAVIAFGCTGLGKGGALWFDQFELTFDDSAHSGDVEGAMMGELAIAWIALDSALGKVPDGAAEASSIFNLTNIAITRIDNAEDALNEGADALEPTTDFAAVHASYWHALAPLIEAFTIVQSSDTDVTDKDIKAVGKRLKKAFEAVELAIGQIHGLKSKSHSTLLKTAAFSMN